MAVFCCRICSCPRRDKEHDEKLAAKHLLGVGDIGVTKKRRGADGENYWVLARGRDNYEALSGVGRVLDNQLRPFKTTDLNWSQLI